MKKQISYRFIHHSILLDPLDLITFLRPCKLNSKIIMNPHFITHIFKGVSYIRKAVLLYLQVVYCTVLSFCVSFLLHKFYCRRLCSCLEHAIVCDRLILPSL
jgi:hypothetical protein